MELKEVIGIIEYVRENDRERDEEDPLIEIRHLLLYILYELKTINSDPNENNEEGHEKTPF